MMNSIFPLLRARATLLIVPLLVSGAACRDDFASVATDDTSDTGGTDEAGAGGTFFDEACLLDADCAPKTHCNLGLCVSGCNETSAPDACSDGLQCSSRGRCVSDIENNETQETFAPLPVGTGVDLSVARTPLEADKSVNIISNSSDRPQRWRITIDRPGVEFDASIHNLAPGDSAAIGVKIDIDSLEFATTSIPVTVHTSEGTLTWVIELPRSPTAHYTGLLRFEEGIPHSESKIGLNLEFLADGTVAGQTFSEQSLGWPRDTQVRGQWDPETRDVEITIFDVIPKDAIGVENPPFNPIARDVGRRLILTGALDERYEQITGVLVEQLSGLTDTLSTVRGPFNLRADGKLRPESATVVDFEPQSPVHVPVWEFPPDIDDLECGELGHGSRYGTDATVPGGDASSCAQCVGLGPHCTSTPAVACAKALLAAGANLPTEIPGNAPGTIQPPASAAWGTCVSTAPPVYSADGTTCLDRAAVRCAGRLMRHALVLDGGSSEDHLVAYLDQVATEAEMGAAVGTEMLIRSMFAYKEATGAAVWLTERDRLAEAQALLQRPLRVMYAPGFHHVMSGLGKPVIKNQRFGEDIQRVLDVGSRSAETSVAQLRLAQRTLPGDPPRVFARASATSQHGGTCKPCSCTTSSIASISRQPMPNSR